MSTPPGEIWADWFPEKALADVLAGNDVVANIGQVKGLWKCALEREVKAGRLVKWRGKWFPTAGAPYGLGPDKTCYGTIERRDFYKGWRESFPDHKEATPRDEASE